MSTVITDGVTVAVTDELAGPPYGVLGGSEKWEQEEPNPGSISKLLALIKTTARNPISNDLQRRPGKLTDVESGPAYACDLTYDSIAYWAPRFLFCKFTGPGKLTDGDVYRPTAVTATGYTVAANGDLAQNTLIFASGFAKAENNGFKIVGAGSVGTEIKTGGLSAEAAIPDAQNAQVQVCGVQGASGDLQINAGLNLETAALDWTTLGLSEGQFIWIGGLSTDTAVNFATAANRGLARIKKGGISATILQLEKKATTFVLDAGAGKTVQVFWGRFARNYSRIDAKYKFRTHTIEVTYPDLASVGNDMYGYASGNLLASASLDLPITSIGVMNLEFTGMDTATPVAAGSRKAGAANMRTPKLNDSFSTTSEYLRLRVTKLDETGLSTDIIGATINVKTNAKGKRVEGTTGAKYMLRGTLEVDIDVDMLFTDAAIATAVRNNTDCTCEFSFRNALGQGVTFDFPRVRIAEAAADSPEHDLMSLKGTLQASKDDYFAASMMVSLFPYLPA